MTDYILDAALLVIKEAEGPNLLDDFAYGRKEIENESQAGRMESIPTSANYVSNLQAKGFTADEIVALASIEVFGQLWDPKVADQTVYPKLDNFYYKQLLTGSDVHLQQQLTGNAETKVIVEKFAQDKKAFHESFKTGFLKLANLGHEQEELVNVENLLVDHPQAWFIKHSFWAD